MKKISAVIFSLIGGLGVSGIAHADNYPSKPIQLVVGYGAGGGTDMCFRALAGEVSKELGENVIVENRPGAGSSLSIGYISRQKPDGYSIAALSTGAVLNQFLNDDINYDVLEDLEPIAMVAQYQVGLLVRNDSPIQNLQDVLDYVKENPGTAYSTAGVGTPQHLTMERLGEVADVEWTHIPFKSGPEAVFALTRGDVDLMAQTAEWVASVRDGTLRLVNVFTGERMKGFEDAPTLVEEGYDLIAPSILGVVGPKGIPEDKVKTLADAFEKAMSSQDFHDCTDQFGLKADYKNAEEFREYIQNTVDEWGELTTEIAKNS